MDFWTTYGDQNLRMECQILQGACSATSMQADADYAHAAACNSEYLRRLRPLCCLPTGLPSGTPAAAAAPAAAAPAA